MMENEIVWATDGEAFTSSSKEEAIDKLHFDNTSDLLGETLYYGNATKPNVSILVGADDVIEMLGERAYDNYGEWAQIFPDLSKNDIKDKAAMDALNTYLKAWITENCPVNFWQVENVQKYTITQEDADKYAEYCSTLP